MTISYSGVYPDTPNLPKRIEIAPGFDASDDPDDWPWIDISSDLHQGDPVELSRGCGDEDAQTSSSVKLTLNNVSGRYTADNPESDLWPLLDGPDPIPLRVSVDVGGGAGWLVRAVSMVVSLDNEWVGGVHRVLTHVEAVGALTVLGQSDNVSAPYPDYVLNSMQPDYLYTMVGGAYDQAGIAAAAGSPSSFVAAAAELGLAEFNKVDGPAGAPDKLPEFVGQASGVTHTLIAPTASSEWAIEYAFRAVPNSSGFGNAVVEVDLQTYAVYSSLSRTYDSDTGEVYQRWWIGSAPRGLGGGSISAVDITTNVIDGAWHLARLASRIDAGQLYYDLYLDDVLESSYNWGASTSAEPAAAILPVSSTSETGGQSTSMGYFAMYDSPPAPSGYPALVGYPGEMAHDRMDRVCTAEGVSFSCSGTTSEPMGPQPTGNLVKILRDCEAADRGILDDSKGTITYRTRDEVYLAGVTLEIDCARHGTPTSFRPVRNESKRRTRMTARSTGGEATYTAPGASGRFFSGSADFNISEPSRLLSFAQLFTAIGTGSGYRYGALPVNLLRTPDLLPGWLVTSLGDRVELANPPEQHARGTLRQQVRGWSEVLMGTQWRASLNTVSTRPYEVLVRDADGDRRDAHASTLATDVAAAGPGESGTINVLTGDGPMWTEDPAHFPFDIDVDGERCTLTSVTDAAGDEFTRTVANGWDVSTSGHTWAVSGTAAQYAVAGTYASISMATLATNYRQVIAPDGIGGDHDVTVSVAFPSLPATSQLRAGLITRYLNSTNYIHVELRVTSAGASSLLIIKHVAGVLTTLDTVALPFTYVAGQAVKIRARLIGAEHSAKAWMTTDGEPADWSAGATDTDVPAGELVGIFARNDSALTRSVYFDDFALNSPQLFGVDRSVDSVVRDHAQGASVALWRPLVRAL